MEGTHLYGDRAPHNLQYVVLVASANLTQERVLTGTSNQIVATDNGAGSTVVLSTPQNIHMGASPTFADVFVPDGGTFGIAGNELLTFNAAGIAMFSGCTVGIGTWTEGTLHVHTATAGAVTAHANYSEGVFENSDNAGITILAPNNKYSGIALGCAADNDYHRIVGYGSTHATLAGELQFITAGSITLYMSATEIRSNRPIKIYERAAAADTADYGQIWIKNDTPNAFRFTDDAGNEVISIAKDLLLHSGAIASATTTINASSDAFDVTGVNAVFIDTSGGNVVIGGFANGVAGQAIYLTMEDITHACTLEHQEATGTQKFYLCDDSDETLSDHGGWVLVCDGTSWYDCGHAKHVA